MDSNHRPLRIDIEITVLISTVRGTPEHSTCDNYQKGRGYLRVSTPSQAGEQHSSLETQENRFKEYCQRYAFLPVSQFVDVVSGRRDDRKEYRHISRVRDGGWCRCHRRPVPGPVCPELQRDIAALLGATGRRGLGSCHRRGYQRSNIGFSIVSSRLAPEPTKLEV